MITDSKTGWTEATIFINGRKLDFAEAMSLRVAVQTFRMTLTNAKFREDLGTIADGYDRHLRNIEMKLLDKS